VYTTHTHKHTHTHTQGGTDTTVRMVVGLYGEEAPKTVAAFLELAEGVCVCVCVCVCVEGCMEAGFLELLEGVCVCVCVWGDA